MTIQIIKASSPHSWYKSKIGYVMNVKPFPYITDTKQRFSFYNYIVPGTNKLIKAWDCVEIDITV